MNLERLRMAAPAAALTLGLTACGGSYNYDELTFTPPVGDCEVATTHTAELEQTAEACKRFAKNGRIVLIDYGVSGVDSNKVADIVEKAVNNDFANSSITVDVIPASKEATEALTEVNGDCLSTPSYINTSYKYAHYAHFGSFTADRTMPGLSVYDRVVALNSKPSCESGLLGTTRPITRSSKFEASSRYAEVFTPNILNSNTEDKVTPEQHVAYTVKHELNHLYGLGHNMSVISIGDGHVTTTPTGLKFNGDALLADPDSFVNTYGDNEYLMGSGDTMAITPDHQDYLNRLVDPFGAEGTLTKEHFLAEHTKNVVVPVKSAQSDYATFVLKNSIPYNQLPSYDSDFKESDNSMIFGTILPRKERNGVVIDVELQSLDGNDTLELDKLDIIPDETACITVGGTTVAATLKGKNLIVAERSC